MAAMNGYILCAITGGRDVSIQKRLMICGFKEEDIYLGSRIKINDFEDFCKRYDLAAEEVMYFGDDIPDIPVLKACGCGVCPSDAVQEAKDAADYISDRPGGKLTWTYTIKCFREGKHGNRQDNIHQRCPEGIFSWRSHT